MSTDPTHSSLLDKAVQIASRAHAGQTDKGGEPYMGHVLRVAAAAMGSGKTRASVEVLGTIGMLHDVVEDTEVTLTDLAREFPYYVLEAVEVLTRREGESYAAYIERVSQAPETVRVVKLADLRDNMNPTRVKNIAARLLTRYERALAILDPENP